jgi:hypothetical protein
MNCLCCALASNAGAVSHSLWDDQLQAASLVYVGEEENNLN